MNLNESTDTEDGREEGRQLMLFLAYTLMFIISWYLFKIVQYYAHLYMFDKTEKAQNWIAVGGGYFILNLCLIAGFIIILVPRICGRVPENMSLATSDILLPKLIGNDGGTRFTIYTVGFYFKSFTETQGFLVDLERERTCESGETTITIKKVSLLIKLKLIYVPSMKYLSAYLQNGSTEKERNEIVQTLLSKAQELAEVIASSEYDSTEKVRANQDKIGKLILDKIRIMALEYGFNIKHVIFSKCDYSKETQEKLNSLIEAEAIEEIAARLILIPGVSGEVALEMANLMSKNPNMKLNRNINRVEISADSNTLEILNSMFNGVSPEVRAELMKEMIKTKTNKKKTS